MTIVNVGSLDEVDGKSGVAHVLEHMMFKRTINMKEGEFSRRISIMGGRDNAFTSKEMTGYHQQVHKDSIKEVMKLEADRMRNLIIDKNDFEKELKVVLQERLLRTEDNAKGLAYEALLAQSFMASPVRRPIIGWRNDIENLATVDAVEWYENWYVPNNITVIIAGDVDPKKILTWAVEFYGDAKTNSLPRRKPQLEPMQKGERRLVLKAPAKNKFIMKLWKSPVISPSSGPLEYSNHNSRDVLALGVLSSLMSDNDTGILIKKLVRENRKAVNISTGSSWMSRAPGYFVLEATPTSSVGLQELESEIDYEIQQILNEGVSEEKLEVLKRQARAEQIFQRDSLMSKVREAAMLAGAGRPLKDSEEWLNLLSKLSSEDITRVGRKVFNENNLTVLEFEPIDIVSDSSLNSEVN
jgi:zinc protease